MAKKLLVRAIVALLLHSQPAIADLLAPHMPLVHNGGPLRAAQRIDANEKGSFNGR